MNPNERRANDRYGVNDLAEAVRAQTAKLQASLKGAQLPSAAKLSANRANSLLSSGPKTEAGKAVSSRNSFKHGLYSKQLVIEGEDPAELDALRAALHAEHQPQSETECMLVNEMADQHWRLQRARRTEVQLITREASLAHLTAVQRMMSSSERGFYKALKTLTELQEARGFVPQKAEAKQVAAAASAVQSEHVPQIAIAKPYEKLETASPSSVTANDIVNRDQPQTQAA